MDYTIDYFIKKFEEIPEDKWSTSAFENEYGQRCALGHCGAVNCCGDTSESSGLMMLATNIVTVNDGCYIYKQTTPKQRVLAYLKDLKS